HDEKGENMYLEVAYTKDTEAANDFVNQIKESFPNHDIVVNPLSLSVSCHIGPGALAVAASHKLGTHL
ncbi:MAG: DegV family protein, partial [Lachnospiraceae bacterium]|nr:DegV family protein [Lachnospiraceae bacterium]